MDGTPFGRYRLIELLGRGGMGEVWRAQDTATDNRTVAIKLLPAHLAGDSTFVRRFRGEAEKAARLNNPHIIPIHNYGEIDGRLYVDMRLIEGRDLQQVLAAGPLEPARAVRIIEQVAKALHAAHKIGLVHRDVKPSNILLDEDDNAYLIDFGIARDADDTRLTATGGMIGSWHYMAPERFRAREADARADIYALACVLYECLTGHRPFPGDSAESQVAAHLTDPPPLPSTTQPNMPAKLDAVIATGMAKNPDERYATTVELAHAAHEAITDPIPRQVPTVPASQPTKPPPWPAAPATITERVETQPPPSVFNPPPAWQRPPAQTPTQRQHPSTRRPLLTPPAGNQPRQNRVAALDHPIARTVYTPWIRRVAAALIDVIPTLIVIGTGIPLAKHNSEASNSKCGYYEPDGTCNYYLNHMNAFGHTVVVVTILLPVAYLILNWGYLQGRNGSTLGKRLLKFKVVGEKTGQPIGFGMSIVRQFTHILELGVGYLLPLWDAKRQTIADKIMGTVCLRI